MAVKNSFVVFVASFALTTALLPATAWSTEELEEVVVSAQKREQKLQDVAMSISALGGDQIIALGIKSAVDLVAQVPGLQVSGGGGGTVNTFNIRGVTQNAFAASLESPIAVYQDESYLSLNSIADLGLFDVDRIEVLRGPQGTLFGRNATGGVVRYVTAQPSREAQGKLGLEVGEDGRVRIDGAFGGPLAETLAYRLSAVRNRDDGLIENRVGPNLMQSDSWSVRGQLAHDSDGFSALLKAQYLKEDSRRGGYAHVVAQGGQYVSDPTVTDFFGYREPDSDPFTGSMDVPGWNRNSVTDLTASLDWDLGTVTLTSVTNFQDASNDYLEDADVTPLSVYNYNRGADVKQLTQELRARWRIGRYDTLLGLYYLRIDGEYFTRQYGQGYFGSDTEIANADQLTTSYAIFGQTEITLTDRSSLEVGARYSHDKKDFAYDSTNIFGIFQPGPVAITDVQSDDGISARLQFNFRPRAEQLWYVGINRGIKSGGLNYPLFPQDPAFLPFKGEVLTSLETGVKTSVGDRSTVNVALFYYDYENYQAFSFDGLATRIVSVNAKMAGGEAELRTVPIDGLELNLGVSYLWNKVRDVPLAVSSGTERAPFAPKTTLNGLAKYSWPALGGNLSAQLDGSWRSRQTFNLVTTPVLEEPAYALLNARVGYAASDERWSAAIFVRNLTDEEYRTYSFDTSGDWGALEDVPGVGRWFGASLAYSW